jgi:YcxB-like protein
MAFCFYHYPRSPVVIGFYGVAFAIASLSVFQALPKDRDAVTQVITFAIVELVALSLLAAVFALSVVLSMASRKNKTVLTEHTIVLAEESFTEETPYKKTEQKWTIVQKLARTKSYILIYVAQHSAHIVPRRAFRDDAEWDAFYEYCRQRTQAAHISRKSY